MGIRDDELDGGLFEAFKPPRDESALEAIARLHGAGASLLLRDADDDASPVLLRRAVDEVEGDPRYQVLGEIARGGIGVVYKGRDRDLNRDIALKVLRPEYAEREDVMQRFIEEAQVGGQLQHPGIVPVYGLGLQKDGRPSFAMKLIKGQTLAELLANNRRGVDLLTVFEQVAQTIAYAHSRGVIHRDLKPANIMVGAFGEVQVVDWGFAKVLGQEELAPRPDRTVIATVRSGEEGSQSIAGSIMGTPAYMPPEQALGHIVELDEASDVFALGAILCEILTGKPPYTGKQKDQLVAASQCLLQPTFERLDGADADDGLKRIVRDCLHPLGADRPRNARVLADRLAKHFAQAEERARQAELDAVASEGNAAREQHAKRRTLVLATAALLLIAVGAGGFLWSWLERTAREERARPLVATALREARGFEGGGDWTAAVAAAQKAVDIAASEGVDDRGARELLVRAQRERESALEADRIRNENEDLLAELEDIRARRGHEFDDKQADAAYVGAMGRFRIDADRLRESEHAIAFAAVFDSWAYIRRHSVHLRGSDWQSIDQLARAIDPEHNYLRDVIEDPTELARLLESEGCPRCQPPLLSTIGVALRPRDAITFLKRALREYPGDFWLHYRIALAAKQTKDHELAVAHLVAAVAIRPDSLEARHRLGIALEDLGDLDGALEVWRDAFALKPDWAHGHFHIARVLHTQGHAEEAEAAYRKGAAIEEEGSELGWYGWFLREQKRHDEAIVAYRKALRLGARDNARLHADLATSLAETGDRDSALTEIRNALKLEPKSGHSWTSLGFILDRQRKYDEALTAYRKGVEYAPDAAQGHIYLGTILFLRFKRYDEALARFRRALEIDPNSAVAYDRIGQVLRLKGDVPGALRAHTKAIELDPNSAEAHTNKGAVLCDDLHKYDEAIAEFRRAIELDPRNAIAYGDLGNAYRGKRDLGAAIRYYRKSLELGSTPEIHTNHGAVLCDDLHRYDEAIEQFQRALELRPGFASALHSLSVAWSKKGDERFAKGDIADAIAAYQRAIEHAPRNDYAHFRLGVALHMDGKLDDALREYQKARDLSPGQVIVHLSIANVRLAKGERETALTAVRMAHRLDPALVAANLANWQRDPADAQFWAEVDKLLESDK